jgi:peptidoglycan/xylan/chitin deacetylase (PgdA/CDA1 family)
VAPDREARRAARLERQRRLRRRRLTALAVVLVAFAALTTGLIHAVGGGGTVGDAGPATPPASVRVGGGRATGTAKPTLEERATREVERLVEIGLPLYCGGGKGRYVALTFDDGPGPYTERYTFPLFRHTGTRVTWFVVGRNIAEWPAVPKRELAFGAVGDHTWNHAYLPGLDANATKAELASTQTELQRATGTEITLFRPPYGAHNAPIDRQAQALGMLGVLWSIDSRDSDGAGWRRISRHVLAHVRAGSIILFHENRGQTIRALKFQILPELHRRHFRTVTVPELLALDPPSRRQLEAGQRGC